MANAHSANGHTRGAGGRASEGKGTREGREGRGLLARGITSRPQGTQVGSHGAANAGWRLPSSQARQAGSVSGASTLQRPPAPPAACNEAAGGMGFLTGQVMGGQVQRGGGAALSVQRSGASGRGGLVWRGWVWGGGGTPAKSWRLAPAHRCHRIRCSLDGLAGRAAGAVHATTVPDPLRQGGIAAAGGAATAGCDIAGAAGASAGGPSCIAMPSKSSRRTGAPGERLSRRRPDGGLDLRGAPGGFAGGCSSWPCGVAGSPCGPGKP